MSQATSIRNSIRTVINTLGSTASLYSFSSATKTENDEGEITITWGSPSSIKVVSSNNYKLRRLLEKQGEENNQSDRIVYLRDDVTVGVRDKLTIGTDVYLIHEIKNIDPIQDTTIAQKITLIKDELYT